MSAEYEQLFYSPFIKHEDKELTKLVAKNFPDVSRRVRRHIRMFAVNFLIWGKVASPRGKGWFVEKVDSKWHTHYLTIKAQNALAQKGFLTIQKGRGFWNNKENQKKQKGECSILSPTPKFYEVFGSKFVISTFRTNLRELPDVIIKSKDKYNKQYFINKHKHHQYAINTLNNISHLTNTTIPTALRTTNCKRLLLETTGIINSYLERIKVGLKQPYEHPILENVKMTRIFTDERCGRFFQKGGLSYQELPKEFRRENLLIDSSPTVEIDFVAVHINLLYIKAGKAPVGEAYMPIIEKLIGRPDPALRPIVKQMTIPTINCKNFQQFSRAMNKPGPKGQISEERQCVLKLKEYGKNLRDFIAAVKEAHPDIAHFILSGECMSLELMFHDSNIIAKVLLRLFSEGIPVLPLHDSIICKEGDEEIVRRAMLEESKSYTGFEIPVKINKLHIETQTFMDIENVSKIETEQSQKCEKIQFLLAEQQ